MLSVDSPPLVMTTLAYDPPLPPPPVAGLPVAAPPAPPPPRASASSDVTPVGHAHAASDVVKTCEDTRRSSGYRDHERSRARYAILRSAVAAAFAGIVSV